MKYPLVLVRWADSYGVSSSWEPLEDASEPVPHECISVGWKVADTKRCIVVVPHLSEENEKIGAVESGCGDMTIPKSAILSMKKLKP